MAEVFFYHLTARPLEAALPELLRVILKRGMRALLHAGSDDLATRLDARLWTFDDAEFLPHGIADGSGRDALQPVLLSGTGDNRNLADVLVLVGGAVLDLEKTRDYKRVCLMFDGNDHTALGAARNDWKRVKGAGLSAQYHAQDAGAWVRKA